MVRETRVFDIIFFDSGSTAKKTVSAVVSVASVALDELL